MRHLSPSNPDSPRGCLHSPLMSLFVAPLLVTIISAFFLQDARFGPDASSREVPSLSLTVVVVPPTPPSSGQPPLPTVALATTAQASSPLVLADVPTSPAVAASPQPPAPPVVPVHADAVCDTATVVGVAALSIRAAPTRQSEQIGEVGAGKVVEVLCGEPVATDERIWLRVRYGALVGYMSDRYLRLSSRPGASDSRSTASDGCGRARVVGVEALAIRAAPTRQSTQVGAAPAGATVEVLCDRPVAADERVWLRVRYGAIEGYMSDRYLARESQ